MRQVKTVKTELLVAAIALLLMVWLLASWLIADAAFKGEETKMVGSERQLLAARTDNLRRNVADTLSRLHGVPLLIAASEEVRRTTRESQPKRALDTLSTLDAHRRVSSPRSADLRALDRFLSVGTQALGADVIWLVDLQGKCIAASNASQADSFVGVDFSDRTYYRDALTGGLGDQYAVGRASNRPGLFFSAPVIEDGKILGVIAVKIQIDRLAYLVSQIDAIVTDKYGIVILAQDTEIEMRAAPGATIGQLSTADRLARYKRSQFDSLRVVPWGDARFPDLQRIAQQSLPALLERRDIPGENVGIQAISPLLQWDHLRQQRQDQFLLLATAGTVFVLVVGGLVISASTRRRSALAMRRSLSLISATIESTSDAILVVDGEGKVSRFNQRFIEFWGIPSELAAAQDDAKLLEFVCQQLIDPQQFVAGVQALYEHPERDSFDVLHFHDGRVLERQSFPQRLGEQIVGRVWNFRDITERRRDEEQIRTLAFYDPLTHLPNRRLLIDRLGHAMIRGERHSQYGALLFMDLDHFKTLNDTEGHDAGDRLLVQVAARLNETVRECDTVSRLGGDEFVVLLEDLDADKGRAARQVSAIADKIHQALARQDRTDAEREGTAKDFNISISASIGICLFLGHETTQEQLLKHADIAMYQSKAAGRGTNRFFDPEMQLTLERRVTLQGELHQALARSELVLHYQPQVDRAGQIVGAEALIRWQHPERGLLPPLEFIPLAEETGLIVPIGFWVLETACELLAEWSADPVRRHLQMAVNLSSRQFRRADLVTQIQQVLERSRVDPRLLVLELTESLVVENMKDAGAKMRELKAMGVGFALDDFGTGSSSLAYLKHLPLDKLKIDKSFVMDLEVDSNDAAICAAIIGLAHNLNLQVVAEGVETAAQRDFLAIGHGCDVLQGYLFGRPLPLADFEQVLTLWPKNRLGRVA